VGWGEALTWRRREAAELRRERRAGGGESEERSVHRRAAVMTWPREALGGVVCAGRRRGSEVPAAA
jgi:hypothetical protein